ncbi:MAG TPA: hypothetical protein VE685_20865 [Thermoanaerobaculia bacterium]|nr:hypothetical protein [Thermoanaerobaculia bacterium]
MAIPEKLPDAPSSEDVDLQEVCSYDDLSEDALVLLAEQIFLELDREESQD